ncbi:hypothetical protein HMSSN036_28560 [Paenibacillus macerans]|nr:hypothetical protein HMSSN036_28560 [Paenibacillus macerans]
MIVQRILKNTKWELLCYFLLTGGLTAAALYIGSKTGVIHVGDPHVWIYDIAGIVVFTLIIGYIAGRRFRAKSICFI